jgi:hypothetical protein
MTATVESTEADLHATLTRLCHHAKREMPCTRRFSKDPLTPWDEAHKRINDRLDQLDMLQLEWHTTVESQP